jgi:hypothetical protein
MRRGYNVIGVSFSRGERHKDLCVCVCVCVCVYIVFMNSFNCVNLREETLLAFELESTCE